MLRAGATVGQPSNPPMNTCDPNTLIEKVKALPAERLAEVEDFVDFLRMRLDDSALVTAAAKRSEEAFARVWDNVDDSAYDRL
ncbi:MAG: DUF2281 domain-containing protein [Pseudomonadota bacterium]|nr:DUF2281 domain-containing protein [Pseudomonadota bacterium]